MDIVFHVKLNILVWIMFSSLVLTGFWGRAKPAGKCISLRLRFRFHHVSKPHSNLLAEEAVDQENEEALQAIDDGEEVSHDPGSWAYLQDAQTPRAAQDEDLSYCFQGQHPCILDGWHFMVEGGEFLFQNPKDQEKKY